MILKIKIIKLNQNFFICQKIITYLFTKISKNSNIVNIKIDSAQLNYGYNENFLAIILLFFNETYFYFILFSVFFGLLEKKLKKI